MKKYKLFIATEDIKEPFNEGSYNTIKECNDRLYSLRVFSLSRVTCSYIITRKNDKDKITHLCVYCYD